MRFGGASGSSARWNSSHARRLNCVVGDGSPSHIDSLPRSPSSLVSTEPLLILNM
jgi:hypothetical protein